MQLIKQQRYKNKKPVKSGFLKILIPIVFLLLGITIFCHPMLLNTNSMPGDLGDARLINYLLEHEFLWTQKIYPHLNFFSPPELYPMNNTLFLSDILLGGAIIYIPIRLFTGDPQSALQIFYVIINILNFLIFYLFAKKIFKFNPLLSSFSSFFFAFSLPRYAQIGHLQLLIQFYMILVLMFLFLIKKENSKNKNLMFFSIATISFVLLAYTTFYFAWFLAYGLFFGTIICLLFKSTRKMIIEYFKNYNIFFAFPILAILPFLIFLALGYYNTGYTINEPFVIEIGQVLFNNSLINKTFFPNPETRFIMVTDIGIGLIATLIVLVSSIKSKFKYQILFFILLSYFIFCNETLYTWLYYNFPLARAIRTPSRFIFLMLPIYSILISDFLKKIKSKYIFTIVLSLLMLEQIPYTKEFHWTKQEHEQRIKQINLPELCNVVNIEYIGDNIKDKINYNIDIMYYASKKRKYTQNGYGVVVDNETYKDPLCTQIVN